MLQIAARSSFDHCDMNSNTPCSTNILEVSLFIALSNLETQHAAVWPFLMSREQAIRGTVAAIEDSRYSLIGSCSGLSCEGSSRWHEHLGRRRFRVHECSGWQCWLFWLSVLILQWAFWMFLGGRAHLPFEDVQRSVICCDMLWSIMISFNCHLDLNSRRAPFSPVRCRILGIWWIWHKKRRPVMFGHEV